MLKDYEKRTRIARGIALHPRRTLSYKKIQSVLGIEKEELETLIKELKPTWKPIAADCS